MNERLVTDTVTPEQLHVATEALCHESLVILAMFTQPDFEFHVGCRKHGVDVNTWHEPMSWAQAVQGHPLLDSPN